MQIMGETTVRLYMNLSALMLLLALVSLSYRLIARRTDEDRMFMILCAAAGLHALCGIGYALSEAMANSFSRPLMILCVTLGRLAATVLLLLWILYVDFRLNRSRDHLIRRYPLYPVPVAVVFVLFVINLFTGILFVLDETLTMRPTPLYYIVLFVNIAYFAVSCIVFRRYRKTEGSLVFFSIVPFVVPLALGVAGEFLCFFAAESAGFAVGLIFLYFSMMNCWCFEDRDPAFYNPTYLEYIGDCLKNGTSSVKCAVVFSGKNTEALAAILKAELPAHHETVRLANDRFVYLSLRKDQSYLRSLAAVIGEASARHDTEQPDNPVALVSEFHFPKKGEQQSDAWLRDVGQQTQEQG